MSEPQNPWNQPDPGDDARPQSAPSPRPQSHPSPRPQFQQAQPFGSPPSATPPPGYGGAPRQPQPGQSPFPPPQYSVQPTQPPSRKKRGGAGRVAAVAGIVALAAGAGAGGGVLADRYLDESAPAATVTEAPGSESTTVIQTDPNAPNWTTVADVASQSVVAIQVVTSSGAGQGSGVVIDDVGNIITNNHVVNGAEQILVTLGSQTLQAE
ncbi:MAG: hypothetical protein GX596_11120, partial [Propionibacterium sp.]|nr:hypothetical protein [Propionibacterium sp.]